MKKNEVMEMKEFTDELVSIEEVKEIMTGVGYYAWTAIQEHMCNPELQSRHRKKKPRYDSDELIRTKATIRK